MAKKIFGKAGESPGQSFPIVAMGASAGGLNALECFIGVLPGKFGFSVVFMQHLSTKHKSLLPDLVRKRRPDIDILEVSEVLKILPGKIYLCPPGEEVRISEDGAFRVSPLSEDHAHLPIDEFFISLAGAFGERSIAVIFSGAGTDGARGVQAVRDAGGAVFVQDPATAEFPDMPMGAIGTGRTDAVLPPDEIAREILKLGGAVALEAGKEIAPAQFEVFYRLIHEKTGYSFNHYKKSVVGRRIKRRMFLKGVSSVHDYLQMLAGKDSEPAALAADLMIGITSFFRDRLAWKALRMEVIRKLAALDEDQPVRVWTPACATGEEAYSIAMMLRHEFGVAGRQREIQVFATDLNESALEKAREGKYPASIAADVPSDYMKESFTHSEDGLSVTIGKEIRESVVFARQNLLTDPPFSRLDLIICRNFLIYLEPGAQEKCIAIFHYALRDGGYLFLGNAESAGRNGPLFKSLGHKRCRVYQKVEAKRPARLALAVPFAPEPVSTVPSRKFLAGYQQSVTEFVQQALLEESGPAAVAVNQHFEIVYNNGPTNRYLRPPRGEPTQNLLELLPDDLRSRIRGVLYKAAGETKPVSIRAAIPDGTGKKRQVTLEVSKLRADLFLVIFRERGRASKEPEAVSLEAGSTEEGAVRQLEGELSATRAELHSHIEQLKSLNEELQSSNEELQSSNEELQAANEELETSREELQSLNEELVTVNAQLQTKIEEEEETSNDLNNFLASTSIPTFFLDHRFRVKRFTPAMSRLLKLIPSDVGRPIIDMSQENLGPDLITDAREVLEHLVPIKKELEINGNWYVRTTLPYRTSDNRIEGVVVTYSDISDLKGAEERSRHLASFPQLNPNPIIETDSSGKITFSNPATQKTLESLGMDKENASVFLPADMDEILKKLGKEQAESTLYREVILKDRVFGEAVYLTPHFNVVRIYTLDITRRKRAEGEIQKAKDELQLLLEIANSIIVRWTPDGAIRYINDYGLKFFGYSKEEMIGKSVQIMMPGKESFTERDLSDLGEKIAADVEGYRSSENENITKTGERRWVMWTNKAIKDEHGTLKEILAIGNDITALKQTEKELKGALNEKEILIKELYHRTKNNMNVISSFMVLQMNQIEDPGLKQIFKEVQNRIRTMALVHEMLYKTQDLSKLDLKDYFGQLLRFILSSYHRKDIRLKLEMDSVPVSLYLALPCGLVLNELLSNSIKHAFPENRSGEITVHLKLQENDIELFYSDNGVGLPDGFRLEETDSLGMRIVDGIVKKQLLGSWKVTGNGGIKVVIRFKRELQDGGYF